MRNWRAKAKKLMFHGRGQMTPLEVDFVESIIAQSSDIGWAPSDQQRATLVDIWRRVFG